MKLNLGCGEDIKQGYLNVDFRKTHPLVFECDLSKFPWPWKTNSVETVMMLDFLEHFKMSMTDVLMSEVTRILAPNGEVIIQVPDMDILSSAVLCLPAVPCNVCGSHFGSEDDCAGGCLQTRSGLAKAAFGRMYGGQDYNGNYHMTGFNHLTIVELLKKHGFRGFSFVEKEHQFKNWNLKVKASL